MPLRRTDRGDLVGRAAPLRRLVGRDSSAWILLFQGVSRLSAVLVFAVAARALPVRELGALALASAITAGSVALAPALVGQPLAVLERADERERLAAAAQSLAVLGAAGVGALLALAAVASGPGVLRTLLLAAALGVPGAMAVESHYWRSVFTAGRRRAATVTSAAYGVQVVAVAGSAAALPDSATTVAPFAGLAVAGGLLVAADGLSWQGAVAWAGPQRSRWLPYAAAVSAAVLLVQAVPAILAVTAGLSAVTTYRAGELVFGATNLLIGVAVQTQLTQEVLQPRRDLLRTSAVLATAAGANGALLALLPSTVLALVVGPVASELRGSLLALFTGLRVAFAVASVAGVLALRALSAARAGRLGVLAAATSAAFLLAGASTGGLAGGLAGLALAEVCVAVGYGSALRSRPRPASGV